MAEQLKLNAVRSDAVIVADFDKWTVLIKQDRKTVVMSLEDILNLAAVYKAQRNAANAARRAESYIAAFGSKAPLAFREK